MKKEGLVKYRANGDCIYLSKNLACPVEHAAFPQCPQKCGLSLNEVIRIYKKHEQSARARG